MATPPTYSSGIVKQVSNDTITIRDRCGAPPAEQEVTLPYVNIPKAARPKGTKENAMETKDEPYAWEAREFLRKKLVGQEVIFQLQERNIPNSNRKFGFVYRGKDISKAEDILESVLSQGCGKLRETKDTIDQKYIDAQEKAKKTNKGVWSSKAQNSVRDVKWTIDNPAAYLAKHQGKPLKAVIEHVRDSTSVKAVLLHDFSHIVLGMAGVRSTNTNDSLEREAKFFVELLLLQQDVEVILYEVKNNKFTAQINHPKGNIAEYLLKKGFVKCFDVTIKYLKQEDRTKLRSAEAEAKKKRLNVWENYESTSPKISGKEKEFTATVVEIINGDALNVKKADGKVEKIFLSSIRPPKEAARVGDDGKSPARGKNFRPLYDIPWMFEAREYLRKRLIGKKVNVKVDYIQAARDSYPEKKCCTVKISGQNIAEVLVSNGLATVVKHRQDDEQRSEYYDQLQSAETKATQALVGVHTTNKKDLPNHRIVDLSADIVKAKTFFPFLQRANKLDAVVEFVASGSRLRVYIPKESGVIVFLLAGISCPRASRPSLNDKPAMTGDKYGDEALQFTKDKCLQRDVQIQVEAQDKNGGFIGWLWVDNVNLSVALVEQGLATIHVTAEKSEHYRQLKVAEDDAKKKSLNLWKDYVEEEPVKVTQEEKPTERVVNYEKVIVTEITNDGVIYVQSVAQGKRLEEMMEKMRQEFNERPPVEGTFSPKRGELCAAKFSADNGWYRAKVEKLSGANATVFYIDYGNRETVNISKCARLPATFASEKPFATECQLACSKFPTDAGYRLEALKALKSDAMDEELLMNVEYRIQGIPAVTLLLASTKYDIGKGLVTEGYLMADKPRERHLQSLVKEYEEAQTKAKKDHLQIWQYGDITEDEAKEFGFGR